MKKRGFTLIELLAVIVILTIIALITIPLILHILNSVRKSAFKNTAYGILESGKLYYTGMVLNEKIEEKTFLFDGKKPPQLEYSGEIPKGGMLQISTSGEIALAIHNNKWCVVKAKKDENVRLIKYEEGTCIIPNSQKDPVITLNGKSKIKVKQGSIYQEQGAIAKTVDGENLSYETSIWLDGELVQNIDTSILQKVYLITYQASSNGKTVKVTRTVEIVDSIGPKITFDPEIVTLKLNEVTTYNLYNGVAITDEYDGTIEASEDTVTITGELELKAGTYKITYEAKDSEGNTTIAIRTFIVEAADGPLLNYSSISTNDAWISDMTVTITATDTFLISSFSYELIRDGINLGEVPVEVAGNSISTDIELTETGIYQIKLKSTNEYNGISNAVSGEFKIDHSTPTLTSSIGYNLYPSETYTLIRLTQSDNTFTAQADDPIMNFTKIENYEKIKGIGIHFAEPLINKATIQVFYDYPHSEAGSISKVIKEGATYAEFEIPQRNYGQMRIDIGDKAGFTYKLDRIEAITDMTTTTRNNVSLYINGNARSGIASYSFDGGVTWQKENFKYFTENGTAQIMVKSNTGFVSEIVSDSITVIDKSVYAASILNHSSTLSGVTRSGNTFTTTNGDPQMTYSSTGNYKKLKKARIYFAQPVTKSMYIQIFYAPFSEPNSTRGTIPAGEDFIELTFPGGTYSQLRFDIGSEAGLVYQLDKIELLYEG